MIEYIRADLVPQWKTIESAPKAETEVHLWCKNLADGTHSAFYGMYLNDKNQWEDWQGYILENKWVPLFWMLPHEGPT